MRALHLLCFNNSRIQGEDLLPVKRLDFSITEARGRDQCHSTTKWFETLIETKCFETWILGLLPQITLGDTLKHFDSVITMICLPFGTMSAKFVDENRSSTLLT